MVVSDQQVCNCPFKNIESIKALDKNKTYFIELKFDDGWPMDLKGRLAEIYKENFDAAGIDVVIGIADGYQIKFLEGNSENG